MTEKIDQVRALHLFAALSAQQFETLMNKSRSHQLKKSALLFTMGDSASSFCVLTSGSLKLTVDSPQGIEKVMMIVRPFELFAEAIMFMEKHRYPVNAIALEDSEVICFDNNTFVGFLRDSPDLSLKMLSLLSLRLHKQINEIELLSTQNSTSRVLNYLSTMITDDGSNSTAMMLDTSKKNLASRLSIAPETLSRILHKLTIDGIIEIEGRCITVTDISKYRRYLFNE
ncbi:MAG: CRP-like cAMP-binding protein [Arenicella sp.]|jgi:CRP-like cAMP-binding protein